MVDLDSLISQVQQDSLISYTTQLQALSPRVAGTASNAVARDWLANQFVSFGYDSVVIDTFLGKDEAGQSVECHNVAAYKFGTRFPNHHVIIGAHRDAVVGSPGPTTMRPAQPVCSKSPAFFGMSKPT